jgi:hypothetical protein
MPFTKEVLIDSLKAQEELVSNLNIVEKDEIFVDNGYEKEN